MLADKVHTNVRSGDLRRPLEYVVELTGIAIIYVGLAKLSLALASIHPDLAANWVRSRSRITSGISSFSRHLPWSPRCQRHHCWIDQYSARNCCREHIREPNRRLFH